MSLIRSVNVGASRPAAWTSLGRTSIDKEPVSGPVDVGPLGPAGDSSSNHRHHGGPDQAVYAFAREVLDEWATRLGADVRDGQFGENLTTVGLDVDACEVGERWRVGGPEGPVLEVSGARVPCAVFQAWMGRTGFDAAAWVRRFAVDGRSGAYLRVIVPGVVAAGDPVTVVHRPDHGVTVSEVFAALMGDRSRLADLADLEGLAARQRDAARRAGSRG